MPKHFNDGLKSILTGGMKLFTIMSIEQYTLLKVKKDHRSEFSNLSNWKKKPEKKNQGFNGIRTRDLRVAGALLYHLSSPSSITAVQNESFHIFHIISFLTGDMNSIKLTSLPMCGFIAQLVEQRTGNAEVTGSNPVEALIFFSGFFFQLLKLENSLR